MNWGKKKDDCESLVVYAPSADEALTQTNNLIEASNYRGSVVGLNRSGVWSGTYYKWVVRMEKNETFSENLVGD